MESDRIFPKSNISAQTSSSSCISINVGDYIVVDFNGKRYPGQAQKVIAKRGEIFCSVLRKSWKN